MNATLLSLFQTEPWSLMLLGTALLALSSIARRRTGRRRASDHAPVAAVLPEERLAVATGVFVNG